MKFVRPILLFVLVLSLALPLLCACGEDGAEASSAPPENSTVSGGSTENESKDILPAVIDTQGREINILCWDWAAGSNSIFGYTGEVIYRNPGEQNASSVDVKKKEVVDYVEDLYNCTIAGELTTSTGFVSDIQAMVTANTHDYDMIFCRSPHARELFTNSLTTDLTDISTIHLQNSWWDQNAVRDLSIGGKVFLACGDINTYDNLGTFCVLFNKNLKTDLGITDNFYQKAKDGTWTFDYLMEVCRGVTAEITGDNTIDEFDRWALGTETFNIYAHVLGGGIRVSEKDEDDLPYFVVSNNAEQTYNALDKVITFYTGNEVMVADGGKYSDKGYDNVWEATVHKAFVEGRELFYVCGLINVAGFRSMDDEFGILPIPKTFAEQERYYHTVSHMNSSYLVVPYGTPELEELGTVIEALAMKSQEIVTPEFYENQLKYRDARDDESAEMLDLIFATRSFDLAPVFSWGNIMTCYMTMDLNYASRFDSTLTAAEMAMLDTVEEYILSE